MLRLQCLVPSVLLIALWLTPALAQGVRGECCGDLEERVAELEATTARKGNRKVSLTVSGWVNEAIFFWDDSVEQNTYVGTNDLERTRFRFVGDAKITKDVSAGYTLEIGVRGANSNQFSQTNPGDANSVDLRKSSGFVSSKSLGKVTIGQDGTATYHLLDDADVAKTRNYSDYEAAGVYVGQFRTRVDEDLSVTWRSLMGGFNNFTPGQSGRRNIVRYDTPIVQGWSAATAWGEDDMWDIGVFYKPDLKEFKVAFRAGYGTSTDPRANNNRCSQAGTGDCEWWGVGGSVLHNATGLFVYAAYGGEHVKGVPEPFEDVNQTWFVQSGIERKWIDLGATNIFAEYRHDDAGLASSSTTLGGFRVLSSDLDFWSVGLIQGVENAAMDYYLMYRHTDGEATTALGTTEFEAFEMVVTGARIQF